MSHEISLKKKKMEKITTPNGKWTSKVTLFKNSLENSIHTGGNNRSFITIIQTCRPILHWLLTESNLSA